jgi:hypothetical protein
MLEVGILITLLIVGIIAYVVWTKFQENKTITKYAMQAIVLAFKLSEKQADLVGTRLDALDKKELVSISYNYLPQDIRKLISQSDFQKLVDVLYDELLFLFRTTNESIVEEFKKWETENIK